MSVKHTSSNQKVSLASDRSISISVHSDQSLFLFSVFCAVDRKSVLWNFLKLLCQTIAHKVEKGLSLRGCNIYNFKHHQKILAAYTTNSR